MHLKKLAVLAPMLLLVACATAPKGPSVMALPGTNRLFDDFLIDDAGCRKFASERIGGDAAVQQAQTDSTVKSGALGAVIGAVAGAAIGGRDGAAVGAGLGLVTGTASAAGNNRATTYGSQRQYDQAYVQCMYARGHRVPVQGGLTETRPAASPAPASAPASIPPPPPPPGAPPPPPPGR